MSYTTCVTGIARDITGGIAILGIMRAHEIDTRMGMMYEYANPQRGQRAHGARHAFI